jgi:molybdate transport system regulatory protein
MPAKLQPKIRILIGAVVAIGPGKANLLEAIGRTGSISAAGREMEMSYRRAWLLVEAINSDFAKPLVSTATGGKRGGGAELTAFGADVLRRYRAMEASAGRAVAGDLTRFAKLLRKSRA